MNNFISEKDHETIKNSIHKQFGVRKNAIINPNTTSKSDAELLATILQADFPNTKVTTFKLNNMFWSIELTV